MKRHVSLEVACPASGTDIVRQASAVTRTQLESVNGHRGTVVWLTGQPGSGKSTIASASERAPHPRGMQTVVLDGDNMCLALCSDLGSSEADRDENVRRVAETARLFLENGAVVLVALVVASASERPRQAFDWRSRFSRNLLFLRSRDLCATRPQRALRPGETRRNPGLHGRVFPL